MLLHKIITTQLSNLSTQPKYASSVYEYFLSVKDLINPDNRSMRGVYLASGTDLSGYLLSTNATESYFLDKGFCFGFPLYKSIYQKEFAEEYIEKYEIGFSRYIPYGNGHLTALVHEIKCLNIDPSSIKIKIKNNILILEFQWKHPADVKTKKYKIYFLGFDLSKHTDIFLYQMKKSLDLVYQKSAVNLSRSYQSIYPLLLDRLNDNGVIVKDRVSCNGYWCFDVKLRNDFLFERNFTRIHSKKLDELSREIYTEKQLNIPEPFDRFYGWSMDIWRKDSNQSTQSEKHETLPDFNFKKVSFADSWENDCTEPLAKQVKELDVCSPTKDNRRMVVNYFFDLEKFPDDYDDYENLISSINTKIKEKFKDLPFKQFLSFEISKTIRAHKQYEMTVTLNIDDQLIKEVFVKKRITKQDLLILLDKNWLSDI